ncbi:MAG: L17 family ribosomal protein [Pirellulales bacterium]
MRHRRKGRKLGRSPSHQHALLHNLAAALFLTEASWDEGEVGKPKVAGRIITTLPKAKEVRPHVERCITLAIRGEKSLEAAKPFAPPMDNDGNVDRASGAYKDWRKSEKWQKWSQAMAPHVVARRRVVTKLGGDKKAMRICFEVVAPRFVGRPGGYTRILKLAGVRLGDAGQRAILEFVGKNDRAAKKSAAPTVEA